MRGLRSIVFVVGFIGACEPAATGPGSQLTGVCPSDTPTYETFGRTFMESYCTRCHGADVSGPARHGAPNDHTFDSLDGIAGELAHIHASAGGGPDYLNTDMPPNGPAPTPEERRRLTEWLLCGAP